MGRMAEQAQEQDERENLSGNDMFECQRWEDEMHAIAVGIDTEGVAFKKRMTLLQQPLASRPDATKIRKGN